MPDDGDMREVHGYKDVYHDSDSNSAHKASDYSLPLSSAPEWQGMHNCTCVGRKPGTAHWEDCPRATGQWGGATDLIKPAGEIDWASEARRYDRLTLIPEGIDWTPSAALLKAIENWRGQFRTGSYISDAAKGVIAAHDEFMRTVGDSGSTNCSDPHLGLATTDRLLEELEARGRVEAVNMYQTAGRALAEDAARIRRELPPAMKAYRTVDPR